MRILGVNKGRTWFGKQLRDGGAAVYEDGKVVIAVAEERVSRQKWASGFTSALNTVIADLNITINDFDIVSISTCCENEGNARAGHVLEDYKNLITVNHHLSHAYHVFCQSGFDEALVIVIDGGGNTFSDQNSEYWWCLPREQHSYYLANNKSINLVDRDFFNLYEVGLGELYRAFTHYLGFHSYCFASRTMALAAFGCRDRYRKDPCIINRDGHLFVPIENDPNNPIGMIQHLGRKIGIDFGEPRELGGEFLPLHKDLAAYIQMCVEDALLFKVKWLKENFPSKKLCLSGGLFLNCVLNGLIHRQQLFENIYVSSAPGDSGQCIGNAIYGALKHCLNDSQFIFNSKESASVAIGPNQSIDQTTLSNFLLKNELETYVIFDPQNIQSVIAKLLSDGVTLAVYHGKSEIGPRALGHRSILANPNTEQTRDYLNRLKSREWFMPLAPTIIRERCGEFFGKDIESPFMSFAVPTKEEIKSKIPAVVHKDGTTRVQTVDRGENTFLSTVLKEFEKITGIPMLLNTSFNLGGEPIVESPTDAISSFSKMPINTLVLNDFLIVKKLMPELIELGLFSASYDIPIKIYDNGVSSSNLGTETIYDLIHWIQKNTGQILSVRNIFSLYKEYIKLVDNGKKQTTTRFRPNGIELPAKTLLPLMETDDFGKPKTSEIKRWVNIIEINYKRFGELTELDAERDGFQSLEAMRGQFTTQIYPKLKSGDWVTIYSIKWKNNEYSKPPG